MAALTRIFLSAVVALLAIPFAAKADDVADEIVKDRKSYLPERRHVAVDGKVIGILAADAQPVLSTEGRSGPPDQLCLGSGGNSYRWVYVPTLDNPMITQLQVPTGKDGKIQIYPALNMASPRSVTPWGVTQPFTLVEVEVNNGLGSPAGDSFVATGMKVLEGSKDYPLKATDVINQLKKTYAAYITSQEKAIAASMNEVAKKALNGRKATGPSGKETLMFVTWLPENQRLQVRFRTKISDGSYTEVEGGGLRQPFELPPPPQVDQLNFFPPPPPPRFKIKTGVTYGVEFGRGYEVDKEGKLVGTLTLPPATFQENLLPAPGIGRPVPLPLPPPRRQLEDK